MSIRKHNMMARRLSRSFVALAMVATARFDAVGKLHAEEAAPAGPTDFLNDVMPVLSKAGCNLGTCHGNRSGKGGFRLSLRGQHPEQDYHALVRQFGGRRINRMDPAESLILRKPTMQIAHQGGRRFALDSVEYQVLHAWLAAGAPGPDQDSPRLVELSVAPREAILFEPRTSQQLAVHARFSDGSRRDITRIAVYEPSTTKLRITHDGLAEAAGQGESTVLVRFLERQLPVRLAFLPARTSFAWQGPPAQNFIDRHVFAKLRTLRINPAPVAEDAVFVRRAYLDTLGLLPTEAEARSFIADRSPGKRAALIDRLLHRPEFAEFWALRWSDLLRNEEKVIDPKGVEVYHRWMRDSFAADKPFDAFVRELLTAQGSTYKHPPANYWRALREPLLRAETTAQVFLGVRLQCAKCHNHPFGRWTQDDYYRWAALFARLDYKIVANNKKDKLDKKEFQGEQIVLVKKSGEVKNPATGATAAPRFLGDAQSKLDASADRLTQLAAWLTARDNRAFARAQANRIWFYLIGRGIVEPIDDFRETNPPSNDALLDALTEEFLAGEFRVKHLVRTIMTSSTYQLSAKPNATNRDDELNFSRATLRRLSAEQLLDAQCQVLGASAEFNGYPAGTRAGQIAGVRRVRLRDKMPAAGDRFLMRFGKPERLLACECERSAETTLAQTLALVGGEGLNRRITQTGGRLEQLARSDLSNRAILDRLYYSALSRPPSREEQAACLRILDATSDRFSALQDIAWSLLNAKEFVFRR